MSDESNRKMTGATLWPWLIPLIAISVAAFLLIREFAARGDTLTLYAEQNPGLEAEISKLRFRGVNCGRVTEIRLEPERQRVVFEVRLERWAEQLAVEGSRFWAVTPQLEIGQIKGIEALRSGAYLTVVPGSGKRQQRFRMLSEAPAVDGHRRGQIFHVYARRTRGIKAGAPVLYRDLTVGTVADMWLTTNASAVRLALHIDRRYVPVIRKNTVFWPVTGITADIGLLGAEIETGTLESFWSGAVQLATPPGSPPVDEDTTFWLSEKKKEWLKWEPGVDLRG